MYSKFNETLTFYGQREPRQKGWAPAKTTMLIHPNHTYEINGVVEYKNESGQWATENFNERGDYTYNDYSFEVKFNFKENTRHKNYRMIYYSGVMRGESLKIETENTVGYVGDLQKTDRR